MQSAQPIPRHYVDAIASAFPGLGHSHLSVLDAGMDCLAIDADGGLIFKFPRTERAQSALRREVALLQRIAPRMSLAVPHPTLFEAPIIFSAHAKLPGDHLVTSQYLALSQPVRDRLADRLGLFYAQLHALPQDEMAATRAPRIASWLTPEAIRARALPSMSPDEARRADMVLTAWQALPPDPFGTIYGHFDGHGWNMAFDHATGTLNGIYDFADSGFGDLSQEFIYSDLIAPDLTDRIVARYAHHSGRHIDPERVHLLATVHRLTELAEAIGDPQHEPAMRDAWRNWPIR